MRRIIAQVRDLHSFKRIRNTLFDICQTQVNRTEPRLILNSVAKQHEVRVLEDHTHPAGK